MKKLYMYEPAMCCPTGLCGVSVDPELLRISTVCNTLMKQGVYVARYNLSSAPRAFVDNKQVNQYLRQKGTKILPITVVDGNIVKVAGYPSNEELIRFLGLTEDYLCGNLTSDKQDSNACGCDCEGGTCC